MTKHTAQRQPCAAWNQAARGHIQSGVQDLVYLGKG